MVALHRPKLRKYLGWPDVSGQPTSVKFIHYLLLVTAIAPLEDETLAALRSKR
jgi:hypothetical protein